jgi:hypothetical protein
LDALSTLNAVTITDTLHPDEALTLAASLVAHVDPAEGRPTEDGRGKIWTVLDSPGYGKVELVQRLQDPQVGMGQSSEFEFHADILAAPGYFSGAPSTESDSAKLVIGIDFGGAGSPAHCTVLSQAVFHHTAAVRDVLRLHEEGRRIGGMLTIRNDESIWTPITLSLVETEKSIGFRHSSGEPVPGEGALDDPRYRFMKQALVKCRVPK